MKYLFKKWMVLWLASSITLLQTIAFLIVYNSFHINEKNKAKEQILIMMKDVNDLQNSAIYRLDIGIRKYAISTKEELLLPFHSVISFKDSIFQNLYHHAELFQYPVSNIDSMNAIISKYIDLCIHLKNLIDQERMATFEKLVASDPGLFVRHEYNFYRKEIFRDLEKIRGELNNDINYSFSVNLVLQILVLVLIVPSVLFLFYKLNRLQKDVFIQKSLVSQKNSEQQNCEYFISHIMRGPICRLNGLLLLLEREKESEKIVLLEKVKEVALEIDDLIKNNWNYIQK